MRSVSSPAAWPSSSLTALKPSRSSITTDSGWLKRRYAGHLVLEPDREEAPVVEARDLVLERELLEPGIARFELSAEPVEPAGALVVGDRRAQDHEGAAEHEHRRDDGERATAEQAAGLTRGRGDRGARAERGGEDGEERNGRDGDDPEQPTRPCSPAAAVARATSGLVSGSVG